MSSTTAVARPKAAKKSPRKRTPRAVIARTNFDRWLTLTMAAFIPLMSLTTSRVAGVLYLDRSIELSALASVITLTVLSVSLPHLSHAIRLVTGSSRRVSWALAIAFDAGIVLAELVEVGGSPSLRGVAWTMLLALGAMSAVLNAIAFRRR
jgi:uncharacterized membrane protein